MHLSMEEAIVFMCGFMLVWGMFQSVDWGRG